MFDRQKIIDVRRLLHQHPELAFNEYLTQSIILDFIKDLKSDRIVIKTVETATSVYIKGSSKEVIAYRADMDALNIVEETGWDYASKNGQMHACGHDIHMSVALGLIADIIYEDLKGSYLFIFQPAEESGGGAFSVVEQGFLDSYPIKAMYGIHVAPELKTNQLVIKEDVLFAYAQELTIVIHGKEAHAAKPYEGIDTIQISAAFLTELQNLLNRFISDFTRKVVTFGKIYGGVAMNVISRQTTLEGTVRCQDETVFKEIIHHIETLSKGLETIYGCNIELLYGPLYPNVVNHKVVTNHFKHYVEESTGYEVLSNISYMYGEDFGVYSHRVPSLMIMVGADGHYPLHHALMLPDETIILKTIDLWLNYFKRCEITY